jgi:hypothetical protein
LDIGFEVPAEASTPNISAVPRKNLKIAKTMGESAKIG